MEFFRIQRDISFMRSARTTIFISALFFVVAVALLIARGLNLSIEFTGGMLIEARYAQAAQLDPIRTALTQSGFKEVSAQSFGSAQDVLIRLPNQEGMSNEKLSEKVRDTLRAQDSSVELRRVEFVGPQIGEELLNDGGLALILVSIGIVVYLWLRFEWQFAIGAIVATAHDIVIILGLFALFQWEFSLSVLAAVLAILGYSVNDTVVVFDRIRENFRKMRAGAVPEIIDNAITRTLSRTIMTSFTTQLMVLAILFLGGETLFYFALALTIGIVVGTYSSVLVASPIVMWLGISRASLMPAKKEDESGSQRP
ncbi:MAG: protein translocase subunit SecF [Gammaproteobacteria bacterium]|nr:protein translocase subunit SecF [Gammaproteobacteria bacterium]